jgi:hypothetical protein
VKTLRQKCAAAILSLTFAVSAFAGQIDCPGVVSTGSGSTTLTAEITSTVILTIVSLSHS